MQRLMGTHSSKPKQRFKMVQRFAYIAGFSVLAGLFGLGLTWLGFSVILLAVASFKHSNHHQSLDFATQVMWLLAAGGIAGFITGFIVSFKKAGQGSQAMVEFEQKYVGPTGRLKIYLGFPAFIAVLMTPLFEQLPRLVGEKYFVYVALGIGLAILAICLYLHDRIPKRWVLPIGIIGWLLTLALIVWHYFFGPGAFGHSTMT